MLIPRVIFDGAPLSPDETMKDTPRAVTAEKAALVAATKPDEFLPLAHGPFLSIVHWSASDQPQEMEKTLGSSASGVAISV